ncbi:MAG: HAMP domain-containing sensor histidine kinase [Acidimicrobiia bacterium]
MGIGGESTVRPRSGRRVTALMIGVCLVVVGACLALMMAHGAASREVAAHARVLQWTTSALGSAAVSRAGNAQAVVFAVDHDLGVAGAAALAKAVAEAQNTLDEVRNAAQSRPIDSPVSGARIDTGMDEFIVAASKVLALIESGDVAAAVDLSQGDFEASYRELADALVAGQTELLDLIDETEGAVGRTASVAQVLVTLLIPASALVAYFLLARRQIGQRKIEMEAELQAARALSEAKDQFIAGLSHELRTPLTSIYGFSEILLESGFIDPSQSMELIGLINHESADLSRMVEDLLTAARLEAGALSIEISDLVLADEVEAVLEPFRRVGMSVHAACPPISVRADPLRLRQVIRNLVSNADRYGGPDIRVEAREMGRVVVLTVIDNGDGVAPEIEDRLFQRYLHEGREALLAGSVGLGLAIARSLVEAMGGSVRYFRVDDHSVFSITLPKGADQPPPLVDLAIEIHDLCDVATRSELVAVGVTR